MKKVLISVVGLILAFCCLCSSTFAYSNRYYSIDIAGSFQKNQDDGTTTTFVANGTTQIGISVVDNSDAESEVELVKAILDGKKDIDSVVDYLMSENPNMTKNNISEKEITKVTKNKYDAIHVGLKETQNGTSVFYDVYIMSADEHFYMISVASIGSDSALDSSEVKNAIDSFTILNEDVYASKKSNSDEKESKDTIKIVVVIAAAVIIIVLVVGVVIVCSVKKKE